MLSDCFPHAFLVFQTTPACQGTASMPVKMEVVDSIQSPFIMPGSLYSISLLHKAACVAYWPSAGCMQISTSMFQAGWDSCLLHKPCSDSIPGSFFAVACQVLANPSADVQESPAVTKADLKQRGIRPYDEKVPGLCPDLVQSQTASKASIQDHLSMAA